MTKSEGYEQMAQFVRQISRLTKDNECQTREHGVRLDRASRGLTAARGLVSRANLGAFSEA
ncbi:hypothetical protein SBA4_1360017 [Candidatus Sulfopaludibacter sp. SbA4]|nr:hypothetical protein SBA4_1360017 [Candidatus Sulfopaludibacter sp. SbA4]